jgi:hypothetical protein
MNMLTFTRSAARWVGRHALPAVAATAIALGAAGGGIGYAVASQDTTTAPASSAAGATKPAPSSAATRKASGARAALRIQRALSLLASQTGQTVASVRSQLEAGKSVDDIAGAKAPAIASSILAQVTKLADRAVSAGRITAAQETAGLAVAKTRIAALMAEPGTQLIKDARSALQFLHAHGAKRRAAPAAGAPATTAPTPIA